MLDLHKTHTQTDGDTRYEYTGYACNETLYKLTANVYLKSNLLNIIHKSCNTAPLNKKCLCNVFLHSLKCLFRVFTEGSANQAN